MTMVKWLVTLEDGELMMASLLSGVARPLIKSIQRSGPYTREDLVFENQETLAAFRALRLEGYAAQWHRVIVAITYGKHQVRAATLTQHIQHRKDLGWIPEDWEPTGTPLETVEELHSETGDDAGHSGWLLDLQADTAARAVEAITEWMPNHFLFHLASHLQQMGELALIGRTRTIDDFEVTVEPVVRKDNQKEGEIRGHRLTRELTWYEKRPSRLHTGIMHFIELPPILRPAVLQPKWPANRAMPLDVMAANRES